MPGDVEVLGLKKMNRKAVILKENPLGQYTTSFLFPVFELFTAYQTEKEAFVYQRRKRYMYKN